MKEFRSKFTKLFMNTVWILIVFSIFSASTAIAYSEPNIPNAESNFYVNDFANLFSVDQKTEMLNRAVELAEKADGIQVVVTTITSLDGASINDYATSMYNKYGIGKDDRGILILLSTTDREIWVEVGYGLESVYTARRTGEFIDNYAFDYLASNKFADGLVSLQKAFVDDLTIRFVPKQTEESVVTRNNIQTSNNVTDDISNNTQESKSQTINLLRGVVVIAVVVVLSIILLISVYEFKKATLAVTQRDNENDELKSEVASLSREKMELQNECSSLEDVVSSQVKKINILERKVATKEESIKKLEENVKTAVDKCSTIDEERLNLLERLRHARMIHSNLDAEINASIKREKDEHDKQVANNFDKMYQYLTEVEASLDESLLLKVREALSRYNTLDSDVKKYVKTQVSKIQQLLIQINDLNARKEAEEFNERIKKTCEGITPGSEKKLDVLIELNNQVNSLPSTVQKYIDVATVEILLQLVKKGQATRRARIEEEERERRRREQEERERRRREEEERKRREREEEERRRRQREEEERRRRASSSSSFSHHSSSFSSSHHSGFGGHSGGSGAGRSF